MNATLFQWVLLSVASWCVLATPTTAAEPRKVALLVGINVYQKPFFANLEYAERDVEQMEITLKSLKWDVTRISGKAASRDAIDKAVNRLVKPLTKDDVMLVMFCGHGQQVDVKLADGKTKNDAFFCPYEAVASDPSTLLSLSYVIDDVLAPNVGRKLLLVDACRNDPDPGRGGSRGVEGKVIALPEDTAVMFSCRKGQQAYESEALQHGLFTYCVLESLRGQAGQDGEVSWTDIVAHVNRRMASPAFTLKHLSNGRRQEPIPAGGVPYTVFGRIAPPVPPKDSFTNTIGMSLKLIPAGEFQMGSSAADIANAVRLVPGFTKDQADDEQPQHRVQIAKAFYLGQHEVTVGQFRKFVTEETYKTDAESDGKGGYGFDEAKRTFVQDAKYTWRNPGFPQTDEHPVVNVSWNVRPFRSIVTDFGFTPK